MSIRVVLLASCLLAMGPSIASAGPRSSQQPAAQPAPQPPQPVQTTPANIDRDGLLILIRRTLLSLQDADETGNYTVLRDLGSPSFQANNTATRLGEVFATLRRQNLDLSGIMVQDPKLTVLPEVSGATGVMRTAGFFPSATSRIIFELEYAPVNGRWKPLSISVGLGPSQPTPAPAPPPAAQASPSSPAKAAQTTSGRTIQR